jgi:alpha-N-arabinofuranosidase
LVATGPRGHSADGDIGWTKGFFEAMRGAAPPHGFSVHYYTDFRPTKVKAGDFTAAEWYEVFLKGTQLEKVMEDHWREMGKFDPAHRTKLVVDEWGVWYPPGSEIAPGYILSETITLRDALHTGMTFDIFNRHADKIAMANVAQTINCIHSLFLARGAEFVRTPVYYVFQMYRAHMGGRLVPVKNPFPLVTVPALAGSGSLPAISCSASIRDRRLTVTLTNPSLDRSVPARIRLTGGAKAVEARGLVLTHADMRGTNSFAKPEEIIPVAHPVNVVGEGIEVSLPKQSVSRVDLRIA